MKSLVTALFFTAACLASSPVAARPGEASLTLTARVESFCRIDGGNQDALTIESITSLGTIREVCNSRAGYIVRASFVNLSQGTVFAGADQSGIEDGIAEFRYSQAQVQQREWRLRDAVKADAQAPVYLMVSIQPI